MIISNTSPLMYLAKLGKLDLLKDLFGKIVIPDEVYKEAVLKGKEEKFLDALVIERAIKDNWIEVKKIDIIKEIQEFAPEIDLGEISVISLAKKLNPNLILMDDASARTIAESFRFNVKGTLYVLLKAYKNKLIDKKEIKELFKDLILLGFRISQELYIQLMDELDE